MVQAIAAAGLAQPPRLVVVTSGAQDVDGTSTVRLEQAPVLGLGKVAAVEHPELRVKLVDLDPQAVGRSRRAFAGRGSS